MEGKFKGKPKAIKDILSSVAKKQGWEDKLHQAKIPEAWRSVNDERIYKITKIHKFNRGTLVIHTDSPTWRYELNLREQRIRENLNKELGEDIVKKIIFR